MFSKFFINRPIFATVLALLIVVAGLVTLNILSVTRPATTISRARTVANIGRLIKNLENIMYRFKRFHLLINQLSKRPYFPLLGRESGSGFTFIPSLTFIKASVTYCSCGESPPNTCRKVPSTNCPISICR